MSALALLGAYGTLFVGGYGLLAVLIVAIWFVRPLSRG